MNKKENLKEIIKRSLLCVKATYERNLATTEKGINILTNITVTRIKSLMKLDVNEIEGFLEDNWNHLFSPEENYSGRITLARQIRNFIEKKLGVK